MRILSVNVGLPRDVSWRGKTVRTGIFKQAVSGAVRVERVHLEGDGQADLEVHGGVDKAVYAYPSAHYAHWSEWLGEAELAWGAFGENLTLEGALEDEVNLGDRFRAGTALLEVTQPRIPCHKLGLRHGRPDLPKAFLQSGRSGFYLRVLEPGRVEAGDAFARETIGRPKVSIAQLQSFARGEGDADLARRAIEHPALADAWRDHLVRRFGSAAQHRADD
ncbi:MAG: MOSC domain-containing protein [Myxococcota bacterium]